MASPRSDEAVNDSTGLSPKSKPAPDPSYASARVQRYTDDTTVPVNVDLSLASLPQLGSSRERTHSEVVGSVDNISHARQPTNGSTGTAPASDTNDALQGIGAHFDDQKTESTEQEPDKST
ncbi:hypothetical protein F4805DRAFT_102920 [Annulohypoxylon moriforme]|nr:hypothetical protein F4805DRAFT_102920 [Annulohypoxylon moriforme]